MHGRLLVLVEDRHERGPPEDVQNRCGTNPLPNLGCGAVVPTTGSAVVPRIRPGWGEHCATFPEAARDCLGAAELASARSAQAGHLVRGSADRRTRARSCVHARSFGGQSSTEIPRSGEFAQYRHRVAPRLPIADSRRGSSDVRSCAKPACCEEAAASMSYDYAQRTVYLGTLSAQRHPALYDLCAHHLADLSLPRGWRLSRDRLTLVERRVG